MSDKIILPDKNIIHPNIKGHWPWMVLAAAIALNVFLGILAYLNLVQINSEKLNFTQAYSAKLDLELSLQAQAMREHVIQVEQWLVDIAATRSLNNLDSGFMEAHKGAFLFQQALPVISEIFNKYYYIAESSLGSFCNDSRFDPNDGKNAGQSFNMTEKPKAAPFMWASGQLERVCHIHSIRKEIDASLSQLGEEFTAYYQAGQEMAKVFINSGPLHGNALMHSFVQQGETIDNKLATYIPTPEMMRADADFLPTHVSLSGLPLAKMWKLLMGRESYLNFVQSRNTIFVHIQKTSPARLAHQAQKLRGAILRIQNGLTSVSVARARDGMDSGYGVAKKYLDEFHASLTNFRQLLAARSLPSQGLPLIKTLERRIDLYYSLGLHMADAYIRGGAELGNPLMATFDQEADNLCDMMVPFLAQPLENTGLGEYQINFAIQALNRVTIFLWILIVASTVIALTLGTWLLWRLQTDRQHNIYSRHRHSKGRRQLQKYWQWFADQAIKK
ncbi:MAG: hypothetical protein HQL78_07975 [Magnetococcales bacterium]|nr:hypothetical protein [Magnetococcales bacterium]